MSIEKDYGNWVADPSGLKSGDLKGWRDNIYKICPDPNVGDIVVVFSEKQRKKIGYRANTAEGYNTRWQRVSSEVVEKFLKTIDTKEGEDLPWDSEDYVYLSDGVYIHKDDCWF